ncbi:MAG: hypothetical protein K0R54_175 [Clostridiaceae bacterium]|jgi:hypothetical protein|nr:hypothetical protein [Clostridiaceae bacterium]
MKLTVKTQTALEKAIKKVIEENIKHNMYSEKFGESFSKEIKEKSDILAKLTLEDEDLINELENAIEESIRVMLIQKEEI